MTDQTPSRIDHAAIGTDQYRGLAYFWAYEYRYQLRDIGPWEARLISPQKYNGILWKMRRRVHADFLAFDLRLGGVSTQHRQIIDYHYMKAQLELKEAQS